VSPAPFERSSERWCAEGTSHRARIELDGAGDPDGVGSERSNGAPDGRVSDFYGPCENQPVEARAVRHAQGSRNDQHALAHAPGDRKIRTRDDERHVFCALADDACGIPPVRGLLVTLPVDGDRPGGDDAIHDDIRERNQMIEANACDPGDALFRDNCGWW
jgi:hypothetical protein